MGKAAQKKSKPSLAATKVKEVNIADTNAGRELMQAVLAKPRKTEKARTSEDTRINGVVIGTLTGYAEDNRPLVYYPGIPTGEPLTAITTESVGAKQTGREVALGFVGGDPASPIILGFIHETGLSQDKAAPETSREQGLDVQIDGDRLTLSAEREIVLKCGKSSITLTRAGKVILKGAYLSTHSTGVNRIKGGSVQIN